MANVTINGIRVFTDLSGRRVATLDVKDDICFSKTYEAINAVIGTEYAGWMQAAWNNSGIEKPFYIWFPKLAEERDGRLIPTANGYINTISDDGTEFTYEDVQHRNSGRERVESTLVLIFAKNTDGGEYVFRGVFIYNPEKSKLDHHVFKRISEYAQITTEFDVSGHPISVIDVPDLDTANGNIYRIDEERLEVAVELLKKKILAQPLQKETTIRFDRGYLWDTEGYKYDIYDKCRKILDFESWTPEILETSEITDRVLSVFKKGSNLINYYTNDFKDKIEKNPNKAQSVIYDLYKGTDDHAAFQNFTQFFGNQYSKTAFLFFLKDRDKYLPIKPLMFRKWLTLLGIPNQCTYGLTWQHYMEFVSIIRDIQNRISSLFDGPVSLLDAHSFVWCMHLLEDSLVPADSEFVDYSEGKIKITKEQWKDILRNGVLKEEYIDTLYKFYLAPGHTSTCLEMGTREQVNSSSYITPVVQMSKAVVEYLGLPSLQRPDGHGRWWPALFLGRRLIDGHFEWRVRPELVQALEETSAAQIGNCEYHLEEKQSKILDTDEVFVKALDASEQKTRVYYTEVRHIQRNPYIVEWAKRRENGICLLCGNEGPFKEDTGRPFLETHHIIPLAKGGVDSIYNVAALCPNCHRKMHHTKNENYEEDLQFLKDCVENYKKRDQG